MSQKFLIEMVSTPPLYYLEPFAATTSDKTNAHRYTREEAEDVCRYSEGIPTKIIEDVPDGKWIIHNRLLGGWWREIAKGRTSIKAEAHHYLWSEIPPFAHTHPDLSFERVEDETDAEKIIHLEGELAALEYTLAALQSDMQEIAEIAENADHDQGRIKSLEAELKAIKRTLGWMACQGWTLPEDVTFESGLKEAA